MKTSPKGIKLIKEFEGCVLKAYLCPAGVWTIGYGSTGPHVVPGLVISKEVAEKMLIKDLDRFEKAVTKAVGNLTPMQEEFDAMVSLAFNVGIANFSKSSVIKQYKLGNKAKAASAFLMWNKARVGGKLTVLPGLVRRRGAEKELFLSGTPTFTQPRPQDAHGVLFATVPETSVVPEAPKPLSRSKEVIIGGGLSLGGVADFVGKLTTEDLKEGKEIATTIQKDTKDTFLADYHVPELAALACAIIGVFMIVKRFKDRKDGIR